MNPIPPISRHMLAHLDREERDRLADRVAELVALLRSDGPIDLGPDFPDGEGTNSDLDPSTERLSRAVRLFEQLKNVDSAADAERAVYGGGLTDDDCRAIALQQVYQFRQLADTPDAYSEWCSRPATLDRATGK